MEHFSKPAEVLAELARVVRPGGRLFITFPPFFSPWGAHLYDAVRLPWCQVFLSRPALGRLVERAVAERETDPDRARRVAAEQLEFFDHALNRMTVGRFLRLVRDEPRLRLVSLRCEPPRFRWLRPIAGLPGARELLAGLVAAELERA
jgi:SAM-dependent methyltransferase